jgi:heavy metal translocating P-type ATPase
VYAILRESGVLASGQDFRDTEIFRESLRLGLISKPLADARGSVTYTQDELREAVFQLSGMWCTSCGWLIEHALGQLPGMASAEVNFAADLLKVRYSPRCLPPERIVERVRSIGYSASEYTGQTARPNHDLLLRVGIAAFVWMNVMGLSLVVYANYFGHVAQDFDRYVPLVLMVLAAPSVFYCAWPVLRIAWAGARAGILRMESLLALGILMAYGYSSVEAIRGGTHVYFDTACAIVALVLIGKAIEREAKDKTGRAIALLYRLMPNKARLIVDGRERFVSLEALRAGMTFRVKAGERIPADGVVVEGHSHADESVLTGESAPRPKGPGDAVICGSINTGGVLEIRATRVGAESTLAHIVRTVEQAAASRTKVERAVDRTSRIFIPIVLFLALVTFAGWFARSGPAEALLHAIAVVVIACPCALGIATPLALTAAVTAASRRGILVSDTRVLETICDIDVVVLDKTGTATKGEFALVEATGDTSRMAELAAVEAFSDHPIAKALMGQASGLGARDVKLHRGMGISGWVGETECFIGNRRLVEKITGQAGGLPYVYFGWDREVKGTLKFGDTIRPAAIELCADLRRRGVRTLLLSGDSRDTTGSVAAAIGADDWRAEASPEDKIAAIRDLQDSGAVVAMIGDGVNDAPSLAQADLGIALGSGADIAMHAAPLVLMSNSLSAVTETLDLARRAFRIVRQNLFWAFAYNTAGITLAITGRVSPIMAAGAMVLSSLSVIANSRRLSR